jgi:hypothetical protein
MPAENVASVKGLFSETIGSRFLAVGEVVLPTKYKTEGCALSETQLIELGLHVGLVDFGWVISGGNAAKNAAGVLAQFNITNPGPTKQESQVVKIQLYETETGAHPLKEQASEAEVNKGATLLVALIGR